MRSLLSIRLPILLALAGTGVACGSSSSDDGDKFSIVFRDLQSGLVSVAGTSSTDVWAAGGEQPDQTGPLVLHFDGTQWKQMATGAHGDLWWVFPVSSTKVFFGGAGGMILEWNGSEFSQMMTPGTDTVFGIWGT